MVNFDLTEPDNGILLCSRCHNTFDNTLDPGLIIIPSDLQHFIDHEKEDFEKRCDQAKKGIDQPRSFPSRETYYEHQKKQGILSEDAEFGLYTCIWLKLQPGLPNEWQQLASLSAEANAQPFAQPWHGAPMAMIRRAFVALGSIRIKYIPRDTLLQLRELQDLYAKEPPVKNSPESKLPPVSSIFGKRGRTDDSGDEEESPAKRSPPTQGHQGNVSQNQVFSTPTNSWALGPDISASDIMQWYQQSSIILFE